MTELSVIVAMYNAAPFLKETLARLEPFLARHRNWELIAVDDGSFDGTTEILGELVRRFAEARVLRFAENQGKGAALRAGMRAAKGEFVAFTDVDLPYGLEILEEMHAHLASHPEIYLLYGSRHHKSSRERSGYNFFRRAGRLFFSIVIRFLLPHVSDSQCGIKLFRRELAQRCAKLGRINRFAGDIEFFMIGKAAGMQSADFPVELNHRKESSVRLVQDTILMLVDTLRIWVYYWRGLYR